MQEEDRKQASSENEDEAAMARRLDALGRELGKTQSGSGRNSAGKKQAAGSGYGKALRLSSDFIAGVVVGAALGWGFDKLFDTSPWGLIVLLLLGFAAGVMNVLRTAGLATEPAARKTEPLDGQKPERPDDH